MIFVGIFRNLIQIITVIAGNCVVIYITFSLCFMQYWDALKLCMEQHVPVSEELVEKLTPPKEMHENDLEERNKVLEGIAEVCMQQRQYHLATKKYTQAGNKVKVRKWHRLMLLKMKRERLQYIHWSLDPI